MHACVTLSVNSSLRQEEPGQHGLARRVERQRAWCVAVRTTACWKFFSEAWRCVVVLLLIS